MLIAVGIIILVIGIAIWNMPDEPKEYSTVEKGPLFERFTVGVELTEEEIEALAVDLEDAEQDG